MELIKRQLSPEPTDNAGNIDDKDANLESEQIKEKYKILIDQLRAGDIEGAILTKKHLKISENVLKSPEVVEAICKGVIDNLEEKGYESKVSTYTAEETMENFWLPKEKKSEIGYVAISKVLEKESAHNFEFGGYHRDDTNPKGQIDEIKKKFFVSEQKVNEAVFNEIIKTIEKGGASKAGVLKEKFKIPKEKFQSPEVIEKIYNSVLDILRHGDLYSISKIKKEFSLPEEKMKSDEILDLAYARLVKEMKNIASSRDVTRGLYDIGYITECFSIPKEKFQSPEIIEAGCTIILRNLQRRGDDNMNTSPLDNIKTVLELSPVFKEKLQSPEILQAVNDKFMDYVHSGWLENQVRFQELFEIPEEKLTSPEVLEASYAAIISDLDSHDYRDALKIKEKYKIPKEKFQSPEIIETISKAIKYWLNADIKHIQMAIDTQKNFPIPQEKLTPVVYEEFLKRLRRGDLEDAFLINKSFPLPIENLQSEEIADVISEKISDYFSNGNFEKALELATDFKLPQDKVDPLIKEVVAKLAAEGRFFDVSSNNDRHYEEEDEDDEYGDYRATQPYGGSASIESLVAKFPHMKEFLDSKEMNDKVQEQFVQAALSSSLGSLENLYKRFDVHVETIQKAFQEVSATSNDFPTLVYLNDLLEKPIDPLLNKVSTIFGDFANSENYDTVKSIYDGKLSKEVKMFGVKQGGEAGLAQLEQGFTKFRQEILKPDFNPHILQESKIARDYFKAQIRFSEAEYQGQNHDFDEMLNRYIELHDEGEYDMFPLNEKFTPSETIFIDTVDKNAKPITYSESFLNRYKVINEDIRKAKELYLSEFPITQVVTRIGEKVTSVSEGLKLKINEISKEQGKIALNEKVKKLEALDLRNLNDFQNNFETLAEIKELESDLRQAVFLMGFAKNRTQLEKNLKEIHVSDPKLEDITWTMNFVDHIVNKEVMSQYFTKKQARNKFRELINVKSFEEELSRFQNQEKIGTTPMKFIPTRGILMEFSGHIGDTCWADKYDYTIPASFPNFTSVIMVQNPDTKHERMCGSCMLIETREGKRDGEPLLLIRGLNPIENTINKFSVEDFYKKFTDYAKGLAEKTGKKLAIVIDNHSGGAATNRPILFNYLSHLDLRKVRVPYRETEFNGYDVTKNSYLV